MSRSTAQAPSSEIRSSAKVSAMLLGTSGDHRREILNFRLVEASIGHSKASSGVTGLIKLLLMTTTKSFQGTRVSPASVRK